MRALQLHGHRDIRLEEVEVPEPPEGWVRIDVTRASICASDIKEWQGPLYASAEPNPLTGVGLPVILGHEFGGVVATPSRPGAVFSVGSRVAVDGCVRCGRCWHCLRGNYVLCDNLAILGFDAHGGFADSVIAPEESVHPIGDNVSDDIAALVEPLSVVVHAVQRVNLRPGEDVVIHGGGMIGLTTALVARRVGARTVAVLEPDEGRRKLANRIGVEALFPEDVAAWSRDVTQGKGFDVAFECVGNEAATSSTFVVTRRGARIALVGVHKKPITLDMNKVVLDERQLFGCLAYNHDFPTAISMLDNGLDLEPLITHRISFDRIIEDGFQALLTNPDQRLRTVVAVG